MARMIPAPAGPGPGDTTTSPSQTGNRQQAPITGPAPFISDNTMTPQEHQHQQRYSAAEADADEDEDADEPHAFGIEKGFWKVSTPPTPNPANPQNHVQTPAQIHSAARELLKFAAIYQSGPSAPGSNGRLPKEIDMLSMTQLSWSVLHAVGDINNHNLRLHGRPRARGQGDERRARKKRRRADDQHRTGCTQCGAADSPCWRMGPAGPLTLCNVCGLLFAKRSEVAATIGEGSSGTDGG
ncbi:hypothetical protein QBC39DRAFT_411661 [Podospora conica]|nr:hypothetical protein QBC39DRAFT_411661 [Schizothecium conicum]